MYDMEEILDDPDLLTQVMLYRRRQATTGGPDNDGWLNGRPIVERDYPVPVYACVQALSTNELKVIPAASRNEKWINVWIKGSDKPITQGSLNEDDMADEITWNGKRWKAVSTPEDATNFGNGFTFSRFVRV